MWDTRFMYFLLKSAVASILFFHYDLSLNSTFISTGHLFPQHCCGKAALPKVYGNKQSMGAQSSSDPWPNGLSGGHGGQFSKDPLPFFFLQEAIVWAVVAWAGMSTLRCCASSISSADPEGWFWRGCRGVWHAWTMQVSIYC